MRALGSILAFKLLLLVSTLLSAAPETILLDDGSSVRVLFFMPADSSKPPPLALLIAGGSSNEFMARAQFWFGKELVDRGWAIAVPISPNGKAFSSENSQLFPELIAKLFESHDLYGKKPLLVGISRGGSEALALAIDNPAAYSGVVAAPGRLDRQSSLGQLEGLSVYMRIGEKDSFQWDRSLEPDAELLRKAGARVDAAIVPDARHIFTLDWESLETWLQQLE